MASRKFTFTNRSWVLKDQHDAMAHTEAQPPHKTVPNPSSVSPCLRVKPLRLLALCTMTRTTLSLARRLLHRTEPEIAESLGSSVCTLTMGFRWSMGLHTCIPCHFSSCCSSYSYCGAITHSAGDRHRVPAVSRGRRAPCDRDDKRTGVLQFDGSTRSRRP
jgi:hypothetical protein